MSAVDVQRQEVFKKSYGRSVALSALLKKALWRGLKITTHKHVASGCRQVVVFSFDYVAHMINLDGIYERDELDAFFAWLSSRAPKMFEGVAIDIGANIGNHSLYFSDHFKKVHSYEPNPRTYKVLCLNSELANNIVCHDVGMSNTAGEALLRIDANNVGGSRITGASSDQTRTIKVDKLDSLVGSEENITFIKIDVEGHEYQALSGAESTIRRNRPVILFEQNVSDFEGGESKVVKLLESFGYRKFATIQRYPRLPAGYPEMFRSIYAVAGRFLLGSSMRVVIEPKLEPALYSFIAALPDWVAP